MRQTCKQILTIGLFLGHFLGIIGGMGHAVAFGGLLFSAPDVFASGSALIRPPSSRHVVDPLTGVAMFGFDPISYFTEGQPKLGSRDHELEWQGVTWRFVNEANVIAFSKAPEVYAPKYGGYGVTALARGYFSDGNPRLFTFHEERLYLFTSFGNREVFLLSQETINERAGAGWDQIYTPEIMDDVVAASD